MSTKGSAPRRLVALAAAAAAAGFVAVPGALAQEQPGTRPTTSTTQPLLRAVPTDADVAAAKARVARLEAQAYAANPQLREIERRLAENRDEHDRQTVARFKALAEVKRLTTRFPNAERDYAAAVGAWGYVTRIEWIKDAENAAILRRVLTRGDEESMRPILEFLWGVAREERPQMRDAYLRGKDAFWEAYSGWMMAHEKEFRDRAEGRDLPANFTEFRGFVAEQAKIEGELREVNAILYGYVSHHVPWELQRARKHARRVEIERATAKARAGGGGASGGREAGVEP